MQNNLGKKIRKILTSDFLIFIILLICGMYISIVLCNDFRWDFANYHYYNAFAFIDNRLDYDIVPASVNTFFNPLIELPLYFAIQYFNDNPAIIFALQGIWAGLLLFVLYKMSCLFFTIGKLQNFIWIIMVLMIAISGQATIYQIGSSTNEIAIAFLILWGLYILLGMIKDKEKQSDWKFLSAGLIMGIALGLKSTVVIYCLSAGLAIIICYPYLNKPLKYICLFALGGLLGYLIINGWWMYKLWNLYGNPFFPFVNNIFQSAYFDNFNYRDTRFLPAINEIFYYPYIWFSASHKISEVKYLDIRLTLIYTLLWLIPLVVLFGHQKQKILHQKSLVVFLYVFLFLSFFIWMLLFAIIRYAVVIEIVGALLLVFVIKKLLPNKKYVREFYILFIIALFCCLVATHENTPGWYNIKGEEKYVYVEPIKIPDNTLLKLYNFPTAAVIPELAKYNNFRAVGYMQYNCRHMKGSDLSERGKFREIRDEIENSHKGPIIIIYDDGIGGGKFSLREYEEDRKQCRKFQQIGKISLDINCESSNCMTWNNLEKKLLKETKGYYCRPLKNNMRSSWNICVPDNLKEQILGESNDR